MKAKQVKINIYIYIVYYISYFIYNILVYMIYETNADIKIED